MKSRILNLELSSCGKCPYSQFYEGYNNEEGYYCYHPELDVDKKMVISYFDLLKTKNKWPEIPEWCPLPIKV